MSTETEKELQEKIASLSKQIAQYALKLEKRNEEVKLLGYYDQLTGLPNRCIFYKNLERKIAEAKRHEEIFGILYLDLDYFKKFNDFNGHQYGDQLLIKFTKRLKKLLRESDIIAHLGGDEFCVMLDRLDDEKDCAVVAQKIINTMRNTYDLDNNISAEMTVSIGISTYPASADNAEELVKMANSAVYKAKEKGRDNFQHYSEELDLDARRRLEIEHDLKKAITAGNQFFLLYQPIYDARTDMIIGSEALIRWNHPILGLVPPINFIPIAEKSGLIVPIGEWVIEEACRQCAQWKRQGIHHLTVAVNIAARQFRRSDLPQLVLKYTNQSGIDPKNLMLEITEGTLINDVDRCREMLDTLKEIGVKVSIDDFGTGYSSLTYLKNFPINKLKIDKSFIDDIIIDPKDRNLVKYTIDLGHNLDLTVVAEGVESPEQVEMLKQMDCDQIQGYFYSKPVEANTLAELAKAQIVEKQLAEEKAAAQATESDPSQPRKKRDYTAPHEEPPMFK